MKICYYCQHVLGVGHFHRSLEICRTLAARHQVTMIIGGPDVDVNEPLLSILQLPGLRMDAQFNELSSCDDLPLETVKAQRSRQLRAFATDFRPDCLIIELYPFGRKKFRFELDPLLQSVSGTNCKVFCSLRDILVEKQEGREKFEQRAVDTLNRFFSGLLIHADPSLVTLEETFGRTEAITAAIHYTGFITPTPSAGARQRIRSDLGIDPHEPLIVASIGSGSVGLELLEATIRSVGRLHGQGKNVQLQVFTGPYLAHEHYHHLSGKTNRYIRVERFSDHFVDWLAAADLSVSMAGYNTSVNILAAGVPALMYPFDQNREQRMRVSRISSQANIALLERVDLTAETLAHCIEKMLAMPRFVPAIQLDGAAETAAIIEHYCRP